MNIQDKMDIIADNPRLIDVKPLHSALQSVLDLCDSTPLRYRPYDGGEPFMVLGVPAIRSAIETALKEHT